MNHPEISDELYELYALGVLEPSQSEQIHTHLLEKCEYCQTKMQTARRVTAAMAGMANQVQPPARLRRRVLAAVAPQKSSNNWIYVVAGLAAACVAVIAFAIWVGQENQTLRGQLASMRVERNDLRSALELMSRPETRAVQFGNLENAPRGRVFVSRTGGVVFIGTRLPALPQNRTFELWVIPASGAPLPAGVFRPSATGEVVDIASANINASGAAAVAVTVEPLAGSNAPTTKPFLVVPLT